MKGRRIKGIEKYSDQWIALDPAGDKIIAGDKNLKRLIAKASRVVKKPVLMRVPRLDASFSP